jgi:hypothetical protein
VKPVAAAAASGEARTAAAKAKPAIFERFI